MADTKRQSDAAVAAKAFLDGHFKQAKSILSLLSSTSGAPFDPKVSHNLSLTKFVEKGCVDPRRLDAAFNAASPSPPSVLANPVLAYNRCVVWMSLQQYGKAATTLMSLFRSIEAVDEWLAVRACLLLLELYLAGLSGLVTDDDPSVATTIHTNAVSVISFLSKHPLLTQTPNIGSDGSPAAAIDGQVAHAQYSLALFKARLSVLARSQRVFKRDLKSAMELFDSTLGPSTDAVQSPPGLVLRAVLEARKQNFAKAVRQLESSRDGTSGLTPAGSRNAVIGSAAFENNVGCVYGRMGRFSAATLHFSNALKALSTPTTTTATAATATTTTGRRSLLAWQHTRPRDAAVGDGASPGFLSPKFQSLYNAGVCLLRSGQPASAFKCLHASLAMFRHRPRVWLRLAEACIHCHTQACARAERLARKAASGLGQGVGPGVVAGVTGSGVLRRVVLESSPSSGPSSTTTTAAAAVAAGVPTAAASSSSASKSRKSGSSRRAGAGVSNSGSGKGSSSSSSSSSSKSSGSGSGAGAGSAPSPPAPLEAPTLEYAIICLQSALRLLPPIPASSLPTGSGSGSGAGSGAGAGSESAPSSAPPPPFPALGANQLPSFSTPTPSSSTPSTSSTSASISAASSPASVFPPVSTSSSPSHAAGSSSSATTATTTAATTTTDDPPPSFPPSSLALHQSVLSNLAYVSLELDDPVLALTHALQLMHLPVQADPWKFLARTYASEALIKLNRPGDADLCLSPDVLESAVAHAASGSDDELAASAATAAFWTNKGLAELALLRPDAASLAEVADAASKALLADPGCVEARRLALTVALRKGDHVTACRLVTGEL